MKKILTGKLLYALLLPVIMLFSFTTITDKVNFSGEWKLNEGKSDLGNFANFAARTIKVDQKDNEITISKTSPGFNGGDPITRTTTLSYDGKVTEGKGFGNSTIKSSCKWADDGQSLTINNTFIFERNGETNEFKSTETWTLTKDGMLSLVSNSSTPNGDMTTTAMYNK